MRLLAAYAQPTLLPPCPWPRRWWGPQGKDRMHGHGSRLSLNLQLKHCCFAVILLHVHGVCGRAAFRPSAYGWPPFLCPCPWRAPQSRAACVHIEVGHASTVTCTCDRPCAHWIYAAWEKEYDAAERLHGASRLPQRLPRERRWCMRECATMRRGVLHPCMHGQHAPE